MPDPLVLQISAEDLASAILDKVRGNVAKLAPAATQAATGVNTLSTATQKSTDSATKLSAALTQSSTGAQHSADSATKLSAALTQTGTATQHSAESTAQLGTAVQQARIGTQHSVETTTQLGAALTQTGTATRQGTETTTKLGDALTQGSAATQRSVETTTKLGGALTQASTGTQKSTDSTTKLGGALTKSSTATQTSTDSAAKLGTALTQAGTGARQGAASVETFGAATQRSGAGLAGLATATAKATTSAQQLGQAVQQTSTHTGTATKSVANLSQSTGQAHTGFLASAKSALGFGLGVGTAGASSTKLASSLSSATSNLIAFTGATIGIAAGVKQIGDFQQALANVSTLVDTSKVSIAGFRDQILQLPPALGDSTDLVKGLYQALSAGVAPAQALTLVTSAAKLAQAGLTDTKTSVDVLTTAINAYGLKASDSARLSDQLFETVIIGKTEVKDLASNLGSAIPIAAALGVSFSDLNATVATLTQGGLSTAEAVTAVRSAFTNMIQNAEKFRAVGIDVTKVLAEEGITGLFKRLTVATEGSAEGIRKLIPDAQGLVGALALVGNQSEILTDAQKRVAGALGTTEIAAQKQAQTIPKALGEVGVAFKQLELTLTQEFAEAAVPALHAVRDAVLDIKSFTPAIKQAFAGTAADLVEFAGKTILAFVQVGEFVDRQADKLGLLSEKDKQYTAASRAFAEELIKQSAEVRAGIAAEIDANAKKAASQGQVATEQQKYIDLTKVLVGQVAAGTASADLFRTSVTGLAGEFGGLGEKATGASAGVDKLGSTQDQTQSKTGQLLEGVRGLAKELGVGKTQADLFEAGIKLITPPLTEAAKASGITTDELRSMVQSFAELALPAAELQKQLSAIGITEKQLTGETATLTAAQIRAADAQGLSTTNALALLSAYQDLSPQLVAQSAALQKAGVDVGKLTQNVAALTAITQDYGATAAEIEAAFKRTFGIGAEESKRFAAQLAKDMQLVSDDGRTTGEATLDAFEQSVQKIKDTFGTLPPDVEKQFNRITQNAAGVAGDVKLAFRELGEKTPLELKNLQDKALIAFETIERSGIASPREIARFWVEDVVPKILDAAGELPPGLQRINGKLVNQAKEAGVQVSEALIDPYTQLGIKAPAELQRTADKAGEAFDQIKASGDLTAAQLASVFVHEVAPQLIDAFGKIPPEWQAEARRMVAIARAAGEEIEPALAKAIGDGVKKGVGRALGALDELGQGLAVAGEKARVVFEQSFAAGSAGLLVQLREQQEQLANIPNVVRAAFSGGNSELASIQAYTKQLTTATLDAIELITGKLKALGFDAQGNPLTARSPLANPFDQFTQGAKDAAQAVSSLNEVTSSSTPPSSSVFADTGLSTADRQRQQQALQADSLATERGFADERRALLADEAQRTAAVQADLLKLDRDFSATQKALQAESVTSGRGFADQKTTLEAKRIASARDFADKIKALESTQGDTGAAREALEAESLAAARQFTDDKRAVEEASVEAARTFADRKRDLNDESLQAARDFADDIKALDTKDADAAARKRDLEAQALASARDFVDEKRVLDEASVDSARKFTDQKRTLDEASLASARTFADQQRQLAVDEQAETVARAETKAKLQADSLDSVRDFAAQKTDLDAASVEAARQFTDDLKTQAAEHTALVAAAQDENLANARDYAAALAAIDQSILDSKRRFQNDLQALQRQPTTSSPSSSGGSSSLSATSTSGGGGSSSAGGSASLSTGSLPGFRPTLAGVGIRPSAVGGSSGSGSSPAAGRVTGVLQAGAPSLASGTGIDPLTGRPYAPGVGSLAPGRPVQRFSQGGIVQGSGGTDSVLIRVTPGERIQTPAQQQDAAREQAAVRIQQTTTPAALLSLVPGQGMIGSNRATSTESPLKTGGLTLGAGRVAMTRTPTLAGVVIEGNTVILGGTPYALVATPGPNAPSNAVIFEVGAGQAVPSGAKVYDAAAKYAYVGELGTEGLALVRDAAQRPAAPSLTQAPALVPGRGLLDPNRAVSTESPLATGGLPLGPSGTAALATSSRPTPPLFSPTPGSVLAGAASFVPGRGLLDPNRGVLREPETQTAATLVAFDEAAATATSGFAGFATGAEAVESYSTALAEGFQDGLDQQRVVTDLLQIEGNQLRILTGKHGDQITITDAANAVLLQYVHAATDAAAAFQELSPALTKQQASLTESILAQQQQLRDKQEAVLGTVFNKDDPTFDPALTQGIEAIQALLALKRPLDLTPKQLLNRSGAETIGQRPGPLPPQAGAALVPGRGLLNPNRATITDSPFARLPLGAGASVPTLAPGVAGAGSPIAPTSTLAGALSLVPGKGILDPNRAVITDSPPQNLGLVGTGGSRSGIQGGTENAAFVDKFGRPLPTGPFAPLPGGADSKADLGVASEQVAGATKLLEVFKETGNQEIRKYLNALQEGFADNADQIAYNTGKLQEAGTAFDAFHNAAGESVGQLTRNGDVIVKYTLTTQQATAALQDFSSLLAKARPLAPAATGTTAKPPAPQDGLLKVTTGFDAPAAALTSGSSTGTDAATKELRQSVTNILAPGSGTAPALQASTDIPTPGSRTGIVAKPPVLQDFLKDFGIVTPPGTRLGPNGTVVPLLSPTPTAPAPPVPLVMPPPARPAPGGSLTTGGGPGSLVPVGATVIGGTGIDPLTGRPYAPGVGSLAPGRPLQSFAQGGIVQGSGGTDSVLIWATPGERVSTPQQDATREQAVVCIQQATTRAGSLSLVPGKGILDPNRGVLRDSPGPASAAAVDKFGRPLPTGPFAPRPGGADSKADLGVADTQIAGAQKLLAIFNETGNQEIRKYLSALQEGFADNADQIAYNTFELQKAGTTFEAFHNAAGESVGQLTQNGEVIVEYTLTTKQATAALQDFSLMLAKVPPLAPPATGAVATIPAARESLLKVTTGLDEAAAALTSGSSTFVSGAEALTGYATALAEGFQDSAVEQGVVIGLLKEQGNQLRLLTGAQGDQLTITDAANKELLQYVTDIPTPGSRTGIVAKPPTLQDFLKDFGIVTPPGTRLGPNGTVAPLLSPTPTPPPPPVPLVMPPTPPRPPLAPGAPTSAEASRRPPSAPPTASPGSVAPELVRTTRGGSSSSAPPVQISVTVNMPAVVPDRIERQKLVETLAPALKEAMRRGGI